MKTGEKASRRYRSGLLSAGSLAPSARRGNLKAGLHVATKRLGTSLVGLLLDIILLFTTDKDGRRPSCLTETLEQNCASTRRFTA